MLGDRRIRSCFNLRQRGSDKKRFQYCIGSEGLVVYLRAIRGHSGGTMVDLAVVDNVDIAVRMERVLPPRRLFQVPFEQDKWQLEKMRKKGGKKCATSVGKQGSQA